MTDNGAMDSQSLISADAIRGAYGSRTVVRDVSLNLNPAEFLGLAGPNGCGKTTLLHCLTGYHDLGAGSVHLCGADLSSLNRRAIAEKVAFVPQQTESVYAYSVLEIVLMGRNPYAGFSIFESSDDVTLAREALERLEIGSLADRDFSRLSGGERQLALLARAFVQDAPILMLDEPLTGLDIRHQFTLMNSIRQRTANSSRAALATFHDLAAAAKWCTRLILMREGSVVAVGAPDEIITPENLALVYEVRAQVSHEENGTLSITVEGAC